MELAILLCLEEDPPSSIFMQRQLASTSRAKSFAPLARSTLGYLCTGFPERNGGHCSEKGGDNTGQKGSFETTSEASAATPKAKPKGAPKRKEKGKAQTRQRRQMHRHSSIWLEWRQNSGSRGAGDKFSVFSV